MNTCLTPTALIRLVVFVSFGGIFWGAAADDAWPASPQLQIFNASDAVVEVFWVPEQGERRFVMAIPPGENNIINTTLSHVHVLVDSAGFDVATITCQVPVQAYRFHSPDQIDIAGDHPWPLDRVIETDPRMNVPAYYAKIIFAGGYPIVGSARVDDYALLEAAYLLDKMLALRPDLRTALIRSGSRLCVMSEDEFTTDLPEFRRLADSSQIAGVSGRDFWDARARGLGGSATDPYCSCGEENLLGYQGDPYAAENIFIHEFAHTIHLRGLANLDPTFDDRLQTAFQAAMASGLWAGKYASINRHEYFAEGVQSWFNDNRENDHDHNHVNTRDELREYDAGLAELCGEVFGDTDLRYTKPATRLVDHLAGLDLETAPAFRWPERLQHAKQAIHRQAVQRSERAGSADANGKSETNSDPETGGNR
jgi:hypothetical protein